MRNSGLAALLAVLSIVGQSFGGTTIKPTTTLAAETTNNTSTANTYTTDASSNLGASNISKVDIRKLLYPGATTPIYVHFLGWFGTGSHINVGYTSWDAAQVHRQVDDMLSRGITGAIQDWYGPNKWTHESTAKLLMAEAESRNGQFLFALTEDKGALTACAATTGCDVTQQLISDLTYAYNTYELSPAYMRVNGRPLVFFFDVETDYIIDWDLVAASVPGNPMFIFRNSGGFTRPYSMGSYGWVGLPSSQTGFGQPYLANFYKNSLNYPSMLTFGTGYKGFNDTLASWGKNRLLPQDCGQVWLSTLAEIGQYYSSSDQLPFIQLVTWNDYEEGTALETGIDNCVSVTGTMTGDTLTWSITGNENTIDHYTVFISTDGQNLMPLKDVPVGTQSMDLSSYGFAPGAYTIYVKAVGKPSLKNQMSPAISYTVAATGGGGGTVTPPDFSLAVAPGAATVTAGKSAAATITVTPQGGFSSAVTFSCSNLPAFATCSFAPASVTPGASSVVTTMTITTAGASAALHRSAPLYALWVPIFGLAAVGASVSRKRLLLLILAVFALLLLVHCGASTSPVLPKNPPSSNVTPPGTYAVTVIGAAAASQHTTVVSVTVQ